ncbi:GD14933 [Drosophila simulans]|uniref:GD14933 n=1 Tax=Drosophila simulans TaxID=7240 RepID=B4QJM9_DROSI|nr:GD14933 [Drosophila simulans]
MTCPCAPHGMPSHRRGTVVQTTTEDADCRRSWELETELEQWPEKCLPGGDTAADDAITPGIFISFWKNPTDSLHPVAEHVPRDWRIGNLPMTQKKPKKKRDASERESEKQILEHQQKSNQTQCNKYTSCSRSS